MARPGHRWEEGRRTCYGPELNGTTESKTTVFFCLALPVMNDHFFNCCNPRKQLRAIASSSEGFIIFLFSRGGEGDAGLVSCRVNELSLVL